jgi:YfiH family protein
MLLPKIFPEGVIAAQSTRISKTYDPSNDEGEKQQFLKALKIDPARIVSSKQIHSNKVLVAESPQRAEGYDAIITNQKNLFVMIATADCTPILVYDQNTGTVAAIHAGWRGTVAKIVGETLAAMKTHFGTEGKNCLAFIGACICEKEFEVGGEVAEQFSNDLKRFDSARNKYFVDLKKANSQQLKDFGVPEKNIEISEFCTIGNNDKFYSYRKEQGKTGRMYSVIGMKF